MTTLSSKIAVVALAAGVGAVAHFGFVVHPQVHAANIAAAEACVESMGVGCDEINMKPLEKTRPAMFTQLSDLGIE